MPDRIVPLLLGLSVFVSLSVALPAPSLQQMPKIRTVFGRIGEILPAGAPSESQIAETPFNTLVNYEEQLNDWNGGGEQPPASYFLFPEVKRQINSKRGSLGPRPLSTVPFDVFLCLSCYQQVVQYNNSVQKLWNRTEQTLAGLLEAEHPSPAFERLLDVRLPKSKSKRRPAAGQKLDKADFDTTMA
uniref:Uncharacterized protein n=1 Tax=Globodera rostochiensis TaxID=31243 RepID=A0A914HHB5_GLORO